MRIRYIKPAGDGVEAEVADGAARRLIASGAAEAVEEQEPAPAGDQVDEDAAAGAPRISKSAARKAARRSR